MRYLVTGGGGFIGRSLIREIQKRDPGGAIVAYQRSDHPDLRADGVEVVRGSLTDLPAVSRACEGVDVIFHVAAKAGIWGSWDSYYEPNVIGTRNILYGCKSGGARFLIYTSSPSVVFSGEPIRGENEEALPYPERWPFHYAQTKALAEQAVMEAHNPAGSGLNTIALRPHLVWGSGDPHIAPRILERARAGKLKRVGAGRNKVDMTHVANVASAHWEAYESLGDGRGGGKAYFISDGDPVSLWAWVDDLLKGVGMPPLRSGISRGMAMRLGTVFEWLYRVLPLRGEPPLTRFVAMQMAEDHWFDISAAQTELGYRPVVDRRKGMADLLASLNAGT